MYTRENNNVHSMPFLIFTGIMVCQTHWKHTALYQEYLQAPFLLGKLLLELVVNALIMNYDNSKMFWILIIVTKVNVKMVVAFILLCYLLLHNRVHWVKSYGLYTWWCWMFISVQFTIEIMCLFQCIPWPCGWRCPYRQCWFCLGLLWHRKCHNCKCESFWS